MTAPELFPPELALWAKTPQTVDEIERYGRDATHALLYHLLDVATVTRVLYARLLSPAARRRIAAGLGMTDTDAAAWIPFLAGLHDLGKASPVFQFCARSQVVKDRVCKASFSKPQGENPTRHGTISALLLRDLLKGEYGWSGSDAQMMAVAIGGHHGTFPGPGTFTAKIIAYAAGRKLGNPTAEAHWAAAQLALVARLREALGGTPPFRPTQLDPAAVMTLAGLISVADWIGSAEQFYPFVAIPAVGWDNAIASYLRDVEAKATEAFTQLKWYAPPTLTDMPDFATRFNIPQGLFKVEGRRIPPVG
jgi:CRISPR-associated endonuclease/helicase Cas3